MWKSPRVEMYNEGEADEVSQLELDSVEEARCTALVYQLDTCMGFYEQTEATATCMFYINRLLVMSSMEATTTFMICHT
jgi:hypothetical protein